MDANNDITENILDLLDPDSTLSIIRFAKMLFNHIETAHNESVDISHRAKAAAKFEALGGFSTLQKALDQAAKA